MLHAGYFSGVPAEYVFMLAFNSICLVIVGFFLSMPVLSSSLIFSVLYVWCQINKDTITQFWFGVQVKVSCLAFLQELVTFYAQEQQFMVSFLVLNRQCISLGCYFSSSSSLETSECRKCFFTLPNANTHPISIFNAAG